MKEEKKQRYSQEKSPTNFDSLLYIRGGNVTQQTLDPQIKKRLEELGYIQKEK